MGIVDSYSKPLLNPLNTNLVAECKCETLTETLPLFREKSANLFSTIWSNVEYFIRSTSRKKLLLDEFTQHF